MAVVLVHETHIEFYSWDAKLCTIWSLLLRDLYYSQGIVKDEYKHE